MKKNIIITIGRQFGSGGHEIGNQLATRLNLPLYDNNLMRMAAKELKLDEDTAKEVDEKKLGSFFDGYGVSIGNYTAFMQSEEGIAPVGERMYEQQSALIKKLAKNSSCIIIGRCADYILGDYSHCVNVFIYAYEEERIRRIMRIYNLTEKQAKEKIKKVDKERKRYYEVHTQRKWGSIESHQILLNSSLLGLEGTVDVLEGIYRKKQEEV